MSEPRAIAVNVLDGNVEAWRAAVRVVRKALGNKLKWHRAGRKRPESGRPVALIWRQGKAEGVVTGALGCYIRSRSVPLPEGTPDGAPYDTDARNRRYMPAGWYVLADDEGNCIPLGPGAEIELWAYVKLPGGRV